MTVRDAIKSALDALFFVDEAAVDALEDQVLEAAQPIVNATKTLRSSLDELFTEDGASYVTEVRKALQQLTAAGVNTNTLLPKSANLVYSLEIANTITNEQLDDDVPSDEAQFRLDEALNFEGVHDNDNSGSIVPAFFYEHQSSLMDSICYLDFSDPAPVTCQPALPQTALTVRLN